LQLGKMVQELEVERQELTFIHLQCDVFKHWWLWSHCMCGLLFETLPIITLSIPYCWIMMFPLCREFVSQNTPPFR
jgi:hypothetical protein